MRLSAVALLFAAACNHSGEEGEPEPAPRHVTCAAITQISVTDNVELRGTIAPLPERDASLAPQVAGRITEVLVREGDVVAKDQPLARIEASQYEGQAQQAEAALAKARAEQEAAKSALDRAQRLFNHGIAARQEVDDASLRLANARAQMAEARTALLQAKRQLEWATLKSSIPGTVLKVVKHPGELVDGTPATPILEVADVSVLELAGDATARDLVRIEKGNTATITAAALPGVASIGTVSRVPAAVNRTSGLGRLAVALQLDRSPRPPVGVLGVARIRVGAPRASVVVAKSALRNRGGSEVEVIECGADGVAHVHEVKQGIEVDGKIEILDGLAPGTRVVVDAVLGINDGNPIQEREP